MPEIPEEARNKFSSVDYGGLISWHINKILLICSSYDAFSLEEDGRIDARISREYFDLNLSNPPLFIKASSAEEALDILEKDPAISLIISMYNIGDTDVFELTRRTKARFPHIHTVLLVNYSAEIFRRIDGDDRSTIDYIFCWYGNADLILAIIKTIEDRMNADNDILGVGVQCIMLVEDSVRYYSTYLPAVYKIIMQQSNEFLRETFNEQQLMMRKRARPKILFATNYAEAVSLYEKYKGNMLGVISDVGFVMRPEDSSKDENPDAGIDLCRMIRADNPLMPFLLQSSQESIRGVAESLGVGFIAKYSKTLLYELSDYIMSEFAFGDFVFRDPQTGAEIGRAKDLREMQRALAEMPEESILYHASLNHFSRWMFARGLFPIAVPVESMRAGQFDSVRDMCREIIALIKDYRTILGQGVIARFEPESYNEYIWFARIGDGSIGGKARGLAFINSILQNNDLHNKYEGVSITIPRTVVIATDYFDEFIALNGLKRIINSEISDDDILTEFVSSRLPESLLVQLRAFIETVRRPLAVRSSSKLEDSHYLPFAGVYSTYMIPRTADPDQMLRLLAKAVKSVYASVYFASARQYITASASMLSDEKMAVVIQEICGTQERGYFFPTISGVARSLNFYPLGSELPEEGVAEIAAGLGKMVVDGGRVLRFSPSHPRHILQLSTLDLTLRETQREIYALDLRPEEFRTSTDDGINLLRLDMNSVRDFRNIKLVASTWDARNQAISDSSYDEGHKIITFANVLKYGSFPLAEILSELLDMGVKHLQTPVEIEFAVNLDVPHDSRRIFNFLQIRPIVDRDNRTSLDWDNTDVSGALIYAENAVGVGLIEGVRDIVYIRECDFDNSRTVEIAEEVSSLNASLSAAGRNYVLIGPGRWGSSDPWLGIPVKWSDISAAKVIVEYALPDFRVEPSQGTHFFQNLVSLGVGYVSVDPLAGKGYIDTAAMDAIPSVYEGKYIRHILLPSAIFIFVDGRSNRALIRMPHDLSGEGGL